jgi:hypothetical protein
LGALFLAAPGQAGNEAFLGIGVLGWIVIVLLVVAAVYFLRGRRGRRL